MRTKLYMNLSRISQVLIPKSSIGIEVTESRVSMVEVKSTGSSARVVDFRSIDLPSPHRGETIRALREIFSGKKIKNINIAVSDVDITHHLQVLPPMSRNEMQAIIEQEEIEGGLAEEPVVLDWQLAGDVEEEGISKKAVLSVTVPGSVVDDRLAPLSEAGLIPEVVTTAPLSFLNILKLIVKESKGTAFLYLHYEVGRFVVIRNGEWAFTSEIMTAGSGEEEEESILEDIFLEINRSLSYFKQSYRGENIEKLIYCCSSAIDLDSVRRNWEERLGIKIEPIDVSRAIDIAPLMERRQEFIDTLPELIVSLGASLAGFQVEGINLIPPAIRRERERARIKVMAATVIIPLVLLLTGGFLVKWRSLVNQREILQKKMSALAELQPILDEVSQIEDNLGKYNEQIKIMEDLKITTMPWDGIFRDISLIVAEGMIFRSFVINRAEGGLWSGKINGDLAAPDAGRLGRNFDSFFIRFRDMPYFENVELMPFKTSSPDAGQSRMDFEIRFKVRGNYGKSQIS